MDEQETRTVLITNFSKTVSHGDILRQCKAYGDVKEHFIMNGKHAVFFVSFFDIRDAKKAHDGLSDEKNKLHVRYAISLREIPKGSDACSEDKNQGTVVYFSSEEHKIEDPSEIIETSKKGKEITIKFYDSREALKFLETLKASNPRASPKIAWDNSLRKRIDMLKAAEEIVKNSPQGFFKGVSEEESSQKRSFSSGPAVEPKKRVKLSTNWMLSLFDRFIAENAEEIASKIDQ